MYYYKKLIFNLFLIINYANRFNSISLGEKYNLFSTTKLKFGVNKTILQFNSTITIVNIPLTTYLWKVRENKSPLEWVASQYKTKIYHVDTRFQMTDDPNDFGREQNDPAYLFNLVLRIITISLETINIKNSYDLELQSNNKFILNF